LGPIKHIAASSVIAGGSFAVTHSPQIALSTFLIGFMIDIDHLFDYAIHLHQKSEKTLPSPKEFLGSRYLSYTGKTYIFFHSYELLIPIWLIAFFSHSIPWALWLSISFVAHLLMDQFANHPHYLSYFLTFRMKRNFNMSAICLDRSDKAIDLGPKRYDEGYSLRPFELRVPGDALKDKVIYNIIRKTNGTGRKLLDLGCGMGHTASLLSNLVDVVGIDFSQEAMRIANKESNGAFLCGDAQALPFSDRSFNYVVAKDILEHVPNDHQVLDEILRVCKDGAMLLMYLPCELDGFNLSTESIVKKLTGYTLDAEVGHLRRYIPEQAKKMLQPRGFKNIRTQYFVHFSLGVASLLSVIGNRLISRGKGEGEQLVSGISLPFIKFVFKIFEFLGRIESAILKNLPGAGFFIQADVEKEGKIT